MVTEPEVRPSVSFLKPFLATSCVIPVALVLGAMFGQSAEMLPQLMDPDSFIKITREDATWIASISTVGSIASSWICGFLADIFGRLRMIQASLFFFMIGYGLIAASPNILMLLMGRFLLGMGFGVSFPCFVYVGESAPPIYRGTLLAFIPLGSSIGLCAMYILGALLPWNIASGVIGLISVLSLVYTFLFHDTPYWLLQNGRTDEALKSLRRIEHPANVDSRLKKMQEAALQQKEESANLSFRSFLEPTVWKPFMMISALSALQNGCGLYIVVYYTVNFLKEFKASYDPHLVTIAFGVTRVILTAISSVLLRRMGRRSIGAVSGFTSAAALLVIFVFLKLRPEYPILGEEHTWIPVGALLVYVMTTALGIYPLPWIMPSELFPIKVRGIMCGFCFAALNLFIFITLKLYNLMMDALGLEGTILLFAIFSALYAVFSLTLLMETHNKTLDQIEHEFSNGHKNKRDQLQRNGGEILSMPLVPPLQNSL